MPQTRTQKLEKVIGRLKDELHIASKNERIFGTRYFEAEVRRLRAEIDRLESIKDGRQ